MALFSRFRHFSRNEAGAGTVTSLFTTICVLMIGGLAADYAHALRERERLQVVSDAAVLAGIARLSDGEPAVRAAALAHAERFGPNLLRAEDVLIGSWVSGSFETAGADDPDSVMIVARRSDANANPVRNYFLHMVGIDRFNLTAPSVALRLPVGLLPCNGAGFFARGAIDGNAANAYRDGFCLHADGSIYVHANNNFEKGTVVSTPDTANAKAHHTARGFHDAVRQGTHDFSWVSAMDDIFDSIATEGTFSDALPASITGGPIYRDSIGGHESLQRGMLYIVNGDVTLRGDRDFSEVAILATGTISIEANVVWRDAFLAAHGAITINSNVRIGPHTADACSIDGHSVHLLTKGDLTFNSNNTINDVRMAAQGNLRFNANNRSTGVYAEALGDLTYNSASAMTGCDGEDRRDMYPRECRLTLKR